MIAVDIDLRKVYAWSSISGVVASGALTSDNYLLMSIVLAASSADENVLVEVAGPIDYSDNKAVAHNKRRWTIYNIAKAMQLHIELPGRVLVSPSSDWTSGYPIEVRHKLAKATAKQKDLRECEAMLWSYRVTPMKWRPLPEFLERL